MARPSRHDHPRKSHPARLRHLALILVLLALPAFALLAAACGDDGDDAQTGDLDVMATATVLADIAQNVAGDRFTVGSLMPYDTDAHAFEPTPGDIAKVAQADLFILNGHGLEEKLEDTLRTAATDTTFIEASEGLTPRTPQPGEPLHEHEGEEDHEGEADPHFWLDPTKTVTYVENIRDAFVAADPGGADEYTANAAAYTEQLRELDAWIEDQVSTLPEERRLLAMNHVSHGYFADRYGFRIVGAIIPSVATGESPTAKQLADLTAIIRREKVPAIFVEIEENSQLADQIAAETGIVVVDDLRDASLSEPGGDSGTYVEMMKHTTQRIVEALGQ